MENVNTVATETTTTSFFAKARANVSAVYQNETVRKAAKITLGTCAVLGAGYLAFKYFGSKAADVVPNVAVVAADAVAQTAEAVAEATTSV